MSGRSGSVGLNLAAIAIGAAALAATLALTPPLSAAIGAEVGDLLMRNTVRLSLAWYAAAVCLMLFLRPEDWAAGRIRGQSAGGLPAGAGRGDSFAFWSTWRWRFIISIIGRTRMRSSGRGR